MPKIRTNIYIDEELYREVRSMLVKQGRSFSGWVSEEAEKYVSDSDTVIPLLHKFVPVGKRESWKRTKD